MYEVCSQSVLFFFLENNNNANPDTNMYLQQAIEIARKNNMPVATIQNCIKQTQVRYRIPQKINLL